MIYRILQIVRDRITNQSFIATFSIEIACAIGFGYKRQTSNHKTIDYMVCGTLKFKPTKHSQASKGLCIQAQI